MYNMPTDIRFAAGCFWAPYYRVRLLAPVPRPPLRLLVKMGLAIGLALGVRVGGLLFLCYLGLLLGLSAAWQGMAARRLTTMVAAGVTSLWRVVLPVGGGAFSVMLGCWAPAQRAPIEKPPRGPGLFSH